MTDYERIPEELRAVNQWHCWKLSNDVKIPCQANGAAAKSNDPETWTDFETAVDASQFHSGLAFEITEPWTGIDLDDCIDDNGIKAWAMLILCRFDGIGFAEVSPSGTGIKILTRARKPNGSRCLQKLEGGSVECYDSKRFWTITGDLYAGMDEIGDGQEAVDWLVKEFLSKEKKSSAISIPVNIPAMPRALPENHLERRAQSYVDSLPAAGEGERNNCAFSLAGHLFSFVGEHGERLTDFQIADLMRLWNARNSKPLTDEELMAAGGSAKRNGTPRENKPSRPIEHVYPEVDLSAILGEERGEEFDDEQFCADAVPESGLLKQIFDYYCQTAHRLSCVMGLATAVSICETIFGRRIASHTDMRTNDYNIIIAPTASGKEACETTVTKILYASAPHTKVPMFPPDVQSGNGLMKAITGIPCGIWVCDEFGKVLESILDKKSNNGHAKQIGTHLLKLYGKASGVYGGAAHADGLRNQVIQPHLVLLGLTTGQMFEAIGSHQIQDGLFGRLAFWPVQNRPKRRQARALPVPESLSNPIRGWLDWEPTELNPDYPKPCLLEMDADSVARWNKHADAIDAKMEHESESRAALWGRVAARAMKLAMVHRAARIQDNPATTDWQFIRIELQDIDWGIRIANWLARVACGLVRENVVDTQANRAKHILQTAVLKLSSINRTDLLRQFRSISASEFTAAAEELQAMGVIKIVSESSGGRPKVVYQNFDETA